MTTTPSAPQTRERRLGTRSPGISRSVLACTAALCLAVGARPGNAQAGPLAATAPGLFEIERPSSFIAIATGPLGPGEPPMDWPTYLARYQHVKTTLSGAVLGAIAGAGMVFVVCGRAEDEGSFLGEASCINRDRWFGFVAGGSLIGTVVGGALGASSTGGILGPIGPLRASSCSFREGMRRSLIGAALGSLPAIAVFADGSGALESSFLAPVLQGGGALIATWSCFDAPRLGPIGQPPVFRPR